MLENPKLGGVDMATCGTVQAELICGVTTSNSAGPGVKHDLVVCIFQRAQIDSCMVAGDDCRPRHLPSCREDAGSEMLNVGVGVRVGVCGCLGM